jgi:hypothetical protein
MIKTNAGTPRSQARKYLPMIALLRKPEDDASVAFLFLCFKIWQRFITPFEVASRLPSRPERPYHRGQNLTHQQSPRAAPQYSCRDRDTALYRLA